MKKGPGIRPGLFAVRNRQVNGNGTVPHLFNHRLFQPPMKRKGDGSFPVQ